MKVTRGGTTLRALAALRPAFGSMTMDSRGVPGNASYPTGPQLCRPWPENHSRKLETSTFPLIAREGPRTELAVRAEKALMSIAQKAYDSALFVVAFQNTFQNVDLKRP